MKFFKRKQIFLTRFEKFFSFSNTKSDFAKYLFLYKNLINNVDNKKIILLIISSLLSRIFEFTGLGLFLTIIFDSNLFFSFNQLPNNSNNLYIISLLVLLIFLRTCINEKLKIKKQQIRFEVIDKLRNQFMELIINSPTENLEKVERSQLKQILMGDISNSVFALDQGFFCIQNLITFLIYLSGLFLFSNELKTPLTIGFLCTILASYFQKSMSWKIGNLQSKTSALLQKTINDFTHGLKTIKVNSLENWFLGRFDKEASKLRDLSRESATRDANFKTLRDFLISLFIGIWLSLTSKNVSPIILTTTLLLAYKTSSSASAIVSAYRNTIRGLASYAKLRTYSEKLSNNTNQKQNKINLKSQIWDSATEIKSLTWSSINLGLIEEKINLKKHSLIVIKGKSGAGKTTFLDSFCGLINEKNSKWEIQNQKDNFVVFGKEGSMELKNIISYSTQNTFLFEGTILENLFLKNLKNSDFKLLNKDFYDLIQYLELSHILKRRKGLDYNLNLSVDSLSVGEIKRMGIIRTILRNKPIEIYDEPTSSLDFKNKLKVCNLLKERSKYRFIILSSHDEDFFNLADQVIEIES